jgi:hypothetical protein
MKHTETAEVIKGMTRALTVNIPAERPILPFISVRLARTKNPVDIRRKETGFFIS